MTLRAITSAGGAADHSHGQAAACLHVAGYTFERALQQLDWLLEGDRWRSVGPGYDDVNAFLDRFRIDKALKIATEQRKLIARRIKELQPAASTRRIAGVVGSHHSTIEQDLRAERKAANALDRAELGQQQAVLPATKFAGIVIDPPWPMEKIERDVRPNQVGFDYPTMSEDELSALPIGDLAAGDCHFFCWATQRFLPMALRLTGTWGFCYVCTFVWHKPGGFQPVGLPQFNCEFVIFGRRGTPRFAETTAFPTCFESPRREHSRNLFYETVRRVVAGPCIDMFSREPHHGFAQYGNEPV